jgi:hypothetical protein
MNSTFDEALERLRGTGSEVAGGVAPNHGPMAAEALVAPDATMSSSPGRTDTGDSLMRCLRHVRP